jgi:SAM-dependent methyltransferase
MQIPKSTLYDAFSTQSPAVPLAFVAWLAKSRALPADLHVLDVGCGTGRMLRPYAAQGWRVTGMEPDPDYRARAAAEAEGLPSVEVIAGGWHDIVTREHAGFNWSSQHCLCEPIVGTGPVPRQVFSSPEFCAVGC